MSCDCGFDSRRMEFPAKCQATSSACSCSISQLTNHLGYIVLSTVYCWLESVICNRTTTSPLNIVLEIYCCLDKADFYKKFSDMSTSPLPMNSSRAAFLLRISVYKLFSQLNNEDYVYYSKEGQVNSKNKCSKRMYCTTWERSQTERTQIDRHALISRSIKSQHAFV